MSSPALVTSSTVQCNSSGRSKISRAYFEFVCVKFVSYA